MEPTIQQQGLYDEFREDPTPFVKQLPITKSFLSEEGKEAVEKLINFGEQDGCNE